MTPVIAPVELGCIFCAIIQLTITFSVVRSCSFPAFVQTNGSSVGVPVRDWRGRIKEQNTQSLLSVHIADNVFKSTSTGEGIQNVTRLCLSAVGEDKYIVAHESGQRESKFTCIQFVRRDLHVFQFRESEVGNSMSKSICLDDRMTMNPWIFVDAANIIHTNTICPLQGGFRVLLYDAHLGLGLCTSYQGHVWIESGCTESRSLLLSFRHPSCIPHAMYMTTVQHLVCLASWREGPHVFTLTKHPYYNYMWLLRQPVSLGDSFMMVLFRDLVADPAHQVTETKYFIRIDTVRDVPRPITALCLDDYEICSYMSNVCDPVRGIPLTCPRTCGLCNATRPARCHLPSRLYGQWYKAAQPGTLGVTVNNTFLTVHISPEQKEVFHCITWDQTVQKSPVETVHMLVKEYNDGCRPRYTCLDMIHGSSTVLFFKLSELQTWPLTTNVSQPISCDMFRYENDKDAGNILRSRNYNLLYFRTTNSVQCNFPDGDYIDFFVSYGESVTFCEGGSLRLMENGRGFQLDISPSCGQWPRDVLFTCVETSRVLSKNDLVIVTRATQNNDIIYCWFFRRARSSSVYLMTAADCNEAAKKRIKRGRSQPLLVLTRHKTLGWEEEEEDTDALGSDTVTSAWTNHTTKFPAHPHTKWDQENGKSTPYQKNNDNGLAGGTINSTVGAANSTEIVKGASYAAIGAMLTFGVVQSICCCK